MKHINTRFTILKIAWRNIWRNHRRSFITIGSVFFAVLFTVIMMSYSNGSWNRMIDNMLHTQSGHIQIHQKGYWDDQVIDNFMTMNSGFIARLREMTNVESVAPRLEVFAMASSEKISKGIAVLGIDPVQEDKKSHLARRLVEGNYLSSNDSGVLIGKKLSEYLHVSVGDSLALIGQGYHGASAVGLFPVRGIVSLITPDMDKSFLYMSLPAAQDFISLSDGYSGILMALNEESKLKETMQAIEKQINSTDYEILPWTKTMDRLLKQKESDEAFSIITLAILYLIVGFGIFGTVIMMTNERRREFGVMIALGMSRSKLSQSVTVELLIMSCIGVLAALLVCIPVVWYFHVNPIPLSGEMASTMEAYGMEAILPMDISPSLFINQVFIVLLLTCITLSYPVGVIRKLNANKAIRS